MWPSLVIVVVLISAEVISMTNAGFHTPVAVALAALLICVLFLFAVAGLGYLGARDQGLGFWSSAWRGIRLMVRAAFDLF